MKSAINWHTVCFLTDDTVMIIGLQERSDLLGRNKQRII